MIQRNTRATRERPAHPSTPSRLSPDPRRNRAESSSLWILFASPEHTLGNYELTLPQDPSYKQNADYPRPSQPGPPTTEAGIQGDPCCILLCFPVNSLQGWCCSRAAPFYTASEIPGPPLPCGHPAASLTASDRTGAGLTGSGVHSQHLFLTVCTQPAPPHSSEAGTQHPRGTSLNSAHTSPTRSKTSGFNGREGRAS